MTATVGRWGKSYGVRLPITACEISNTTEKTKFEIIAEPNKITLIKIAEPKKHIPLSERFANYNGEYKGETIDWGDDIGGEICD
jgi:antitoxin component of MazEF toxin-antitoxin module